MPTVCSFLARQPPVGQGLLFHEVSRLYNDASQSVGLLWTSWSARRTNADSNAQKFRQNTCQLEFCEIRSFEVYIKLHLLPMTYLAVFITDLNVRLW